MLAPCLGRLLWWLLAAKGVSQLHRCFDWSPTSAAILTALHEATALSI